MIISLMISIAVTVGIFLTSKGSFERMDFEATYTYLILDGLFIVVATCTYGYILIKIIQNYRKTITKGEGRVAGRKSSTVGQLTNYTKKIILPLLLIATFLLFWIIPDVVTSVFQLSGNPLDILAPNVYYGLKILYVIALISDAFIYTLLSRPIRNILKQNLSFLVPERKKNQTKYKSNTTITTTH